MFDRSAKILIVDDMMTMRKLIRQSLISLGYSNIQEADDGEKAWTKLNELADFDLVISDLMMPGCDGLELLKRVRTDRRLKELPFLILTGTTRTTQIKEAIFGGVDAFILKPLTSESLKEQLQKAASRRVA